MVIGSRSLIYPTERTEVVFLDLGATALMATVWMVMDMLDEVENPEDVPIVTLSMVLASGLLLSTELFLYGSFGPA